MTEKALMIIPRNLDEVKNLSELMAKSTLLPDALRGKAADVFVSILAGQELGLSPMASLRGVHVVQGKPILSADTMVGIVLGSGMAEYFICVDEQPTSVTYETKRKGAPKAQSCTWTMKDAEIAGLIKDGGNWKKFPRAMLKARAKAMLARDVYPDVLAGCYDADEIRESTRSETVCQTVPEETLDAEVVEQREADLLRAESPSLIDAIGTAGSIDDLRALAPKLNALPKGSDERKAAKDAYMRRSDELEALAKGAA